MRHLVFAGGSDQLFVDKGLPECGNEGKEK